MKTLGCFGFERWGRLRPAAMWTSKGVKYTPTIIPGLWVRRKESERIS
jgi:hypothetical protein